MLRQICRLPNKLAPFALIPFTFFAVTTILVIATSFYILYSPLLTKRLTQDQLTYGLYAQAPLEQTVQFGASTVSRDARAAKIELYLKSIRRTKLVPYADQLVQASDKYGLHWALTAAIAGQESSFCEEIPKDSNNCFGWAIHSDSTRHFDSVGDSIDRVSRSLREDFIDRYGFRTTCDLMIKYNPTSAQRDGSWCKGVNYFINEIENFSTPQQLDI